MLTNYNISVTDNILRKIFSIVEQWETQNSFAVSEGDSGSKCNFLIDQLSLDDDLEEEDDDFDGEEDDDFDEEEDGDEEDGLHS